MGSVSLGEIGGLPLSVASCTDNNFSLPGDQVVADVIGSNNNVTAARGSNFSTFGDAAALLSSWQEMCDVLLSSVVQPTHDPNHHARQMLNYLLMGVAGMTVGCFGLIGNLLSAIVLTRRTMTTSTYCYLAALAVCDFLVVTCTLVLLIKVSSLKHSIHCVAKKFTRIICVISLSDFVRFWFVSNSYLLFFITVAQARRKVKGEVFPEPRNVFGVPPSLRNIK